MNLRLLRRSLLVATLLVGATTAARAEDTLPDACGDAKVTFNVSPDTTNHQLAAPADGKALLVFIGTSSKTGGWSPFASTNQIVRFGLDGKWAGATGKNTYFTVSVDPGEHHLCASVQGKKWTGVKALTAAAGKVYFYEFNIQNTLDGQSFNHYAYTLQELDTDEGKFRVKSYALSNATEHR